MISQIKKAADNGYGNALIYTAIITAAVTDFIPTPADYFYFRTQEKIKQELKNGTISPTQYWIRDAASYYLYNPAWWILFGFAVVKFGHTTQDKVKIAIGLASAGAVVGILAKNIKTDEQSKTLVTL